MLNLYQSNYSGADLIAPSAGIVAFYGLKAGTIKTVRVKVKTANTSGATVFNLSKNGTDLFTSELTIASGQTSVSVSGLSVAVAFGDLLILKLTSISAGGASAPVAVQIEASEAFVLETADLTQLKTDLGLTGTNSGDETASTIKTKLGIAVLSGANTGDETAASVGNLITTATAKSTPVDADTVAISDSAASNILKKLSWANVKATLKTYFDTLYQAVLVSGTTIKTINGSSILGSGDLAVTGSGGGSGGGNAFSIDGKPGTGVTTKSDYFEGSSLDSKWTNFNIGTTTYAVRDGRINFTVPNQSNYGAIVQPLPSGDCTLIAKVYNDNIAEAYTSIALNLYADAIANPTTSGIFAFALIRQPSLLVQLDKWTNYLTYGSFVTSAGATETASAAGVIYLRLSRSGTTWTLSYSCAGWVWTTLTTATESSFFTPKEFGIAISNSVGTKKLEAEFIQYTAVANDKIKGGLM